MAKRIWFRVHSFTGVITGLMLFVICWSGTVAVFSYELDWLVTPQMRIEPREGPIRWDAVMEGVAESRPDLDVVSIDAPPYRSATMNALVHDGNDGTYGLLFVDPETAAVTGASSYNLQRFFRDFHRRLMLPNPWGVLIVCVFAITLAISTVAALLFYKRWWLRFFHLKSARGRAFWSELHKLTGLWSLWFILVIALTGLWYMFEMARIHFGDGVSAYTSSGIEDVGTRRIRSPDGDRNLPVLPVAELLARAREQRPDLDLQSVRPPGETALYADGQAGHLLVRDRANQIHLDARTGEVLYNQQASDLPPYWRWSDTADPLHFGSFAGLWSKVPWFLFGLLLTGLTLTGTYLHACRLAQAGAIARRHRWPGTFAAIAVSLVVLAASVPSGVTAARGTFGDTIDGVRQWPEVITGVQVIMTTWIASTLLVIAGWTALLWRPGKVSSAAGQGRSARLLSLPPRKVDSSSQP